MKLFKLKSIINNKMKRYVLYAVGEVLLIVIGILVAMYINNWNSNNQYKKKIDNNFLRVHKELGTNIEKARRSIMNLKEKDSLIYLVISDSIKPEMYYKNKKLAYLIFSYHDLKIEDRAYQNLMSLNISDNKYKEKLLSKLKHLYRVNDYIEDMDQKMSNFVVDRTLPLLAQNTKDFIDLQYKGQITKDVVDFFTTSPKYKSHMGQYAILAINGQLAAYQTFLKNAYRLHSQIAEEYKLEKHSLLRKDSIASYISQYIGSYLSQERKDTLTLYSSNDSILLYRYNDKTAKLNLTPVTKKCFFTNNSGLGAFVSFQNNKDSIAFKFGALAYKYSYQKIE
ncbi:MAG: hypothetical protein CSA36_02100 [Draconibacterium sp.]|nr:MAG: hypothetical protein CSA36_02100 [Draconibacterium sp.]